MSSNHSCSFIYNIHLLAASLAYVPLVMASHPGRCGAGDMLLDHVTVRSWTQGPRSHDTTIPPSSRLVGSRRLASAVARSMLAVTRIFHGRHAPQLLSFPTASLVVAVLRSDPPIWRLREIKILVEKYYWLLIDLFKLITTDKLELF